MTERKLMPYRINGDKDQRSVVGYCPLMAVTTAASWFSGVGFSLLKASCDRRKALRLLGIGLLAFLTAFGGLIWACTHSPYLSPENIAFGSNAIARQHLDFSNQISLRLFGTALYPSFGLCFPLALILPLLFSAGARSARAYPWHVATGTVTLLVGLWVWIVTSNATEVRYFYQGDPAAHCLGEA
jgi:hypothetical protein